MGDFVSTDVWDTYWYFAHARHEMWWSRINGNPPPWTNDPILLEHRFTNSYRVLDRVSQRLLSDVQYGQHRSQAMDEVFFRTMVFKIFNKIETWEMIERNLGHVSWQSFNPSALIELLDKEMLKGTALYSAAYIMPAPLLGRVRKHANHVELLLRMMGDGLPYKISQTSSLRDVYELIRSYPSMGSFLAFQYAIDLNYSTIVNHPESDFVVAGPGAHDGISKCFSDLGGMSAEDVIMECYHRQRDEFAKRGLPFRGLFGRPLQPIDLQNCYCETSKYTRKSHPHVEGVSKRTKIKQIYKQNPLPHPSVFLPPKWNLSIPPHLKEVVHGAT